jgi:hypothetical protein
MDFPDGRRASNQNFLMHQTVASLVRWEDDYADTLEVLRQTIQYLRQRTGVEHHFPKFGKGNKQYYVTLHPDRLRTDLPLHWQDLERIITELQTTHRHIARELQDVEVPAGSSPDSPPVQQPQPQPPQHQPQAQRPPSTNPFTVDELEHVSSVYLHLLPVLRPLCVAHGSRGRVLLALCTASATRMRVQPAAVQCCGRLRCWWVQAKQGPALVPCVIPLAVPDSS